MGAARIEARRSGEFAVTGEMSFSTAPALWNQSRDVFATTADAIGIDLGRVERADSAGLALLVAWTRQARGAGRSIRFLNPPDQLMALAQANKVGNLLGLERLGN